MPSNVSDPRPHHFYQALQEVPANEPDGEGNVAPVTLQQALDYYLAYQEANFPNLCPKCGGPLFGHYDRQRESGITDDEVQVTCDLCEGWGGTVTPQRAIISGYGPVPI